MRPLIVVLVLVLLSGCAAPASQRFVAFGMKDQTQAQITSDALECEEIADGNRGPEAQQAARGGIAGAGFGAATGAILGAILSGVGSNAGAGAAVGAAFGLVTGIVEVVHASRARHDSICRACLAARGYTTGGG